MTQARYTDEDQKNWHKQFQFDHNGRRVWEPPEIPHPAPPTDAELNEIAQQLRKFERARGSITCLYFHDYHQRHQPR